MNARPVLITGGAGYIGSTIVRQLIAGGFDVLVLDNLSTGSRSALPSNVCLVEGDVADRDLVRRLLRNESPSVVIHMAALTSTPASMRAPLRFYANNTENTRALLEEIVAARCSPGIVFSSTAAVYGNVRDEKVCESHPTDPLSPYGASKLMAERMLADAALAYNLRYTALRYFNVVGVADGGGSAKLAAPGSLFDIVMEAASGRRPHVQIHGLDHDTPDGSPVRDFIHVEDIAAAHLAVLPLLDTTEAPKVFNCGNGHGYSVLQVIDAVEAATGKTLHRIAGPRAPGDPSRVIADADLLRRHTGWTARRTSLAGFLAGAVRA